MFNITFKRIKQIYTFINFIINMHQIYLYSCNVYNFLEDYGVIDCLMLLIGC